MFVSHFLVGVGCRHRGVGVVCREGAEFSVIGYV